MFWGHLNRFPFSFFFFFTRFSFSFTRRLCFSYYSVVCLGGYCFYLLFGLEVWRVAGVTFSIGRGYTVLGSVLLQLYVLRRRVGDGTQFGRVAAAWRL